MRRSVTDPQGPPSYNPSEALSPASAEPAHKEPQQEIQSPRNNGVPALDSNYFDPNISLEDLWNDDAATVFQELDEMDFTPDVSPIQMHIHRGSGDPGWRPSITMAQQVFGSILPTPPALNTPGESYSEGASESRLDFDAILKACTTLQDHCRVMKEPGTGIKDVQAILGNLNSVCTTAAKASISPFASDAASMALLLATLYKVSEVCEAVVCNVLGVRPQQESETIDNLFFLKRLDLVLLQAKVLLTRMGHPDAAKKACNVHLRIESSLKQHFHHWMW